MRDLNDIQGRGKRIPGGFTIPISYAGGRLELIRWEILDLVNTDREEAQYLAVLFSKSELLHICQIGQELARRLAK